MSRMSLRKAGTSLAGIIPAEIVRDLHLSDGQMLEVSQESGRIVLIPMNEELETIKVAHDSILDRYRRTFQGLADT